MKEYKHTLSNGKIIVFCAKNDLEAKIKLYYHELKDGGESYSDVLTVKDQIHLYNEAYRLKMKNKGNIDFFQTLKELEIKYIL